MKKVLLAMATGMLALSLITAGALAAPAHQGRYFTDADGNGVCDHLAAQAGVQAGCGRYFVDADGDGVCDHQTEDCRCLWQGASAGQATFVPTAQTGYGPNFVDADGDGVCDRYTTGSWPQDGTGRRAGFHKGCHQ